MNEPPKTALVPAQSYPQPRDVKLPDLTSDTFAAFSGVISTDISNTANMLSVWSPLGTRFVLRGGYILVICGVTCNGAAGSHVLFLYDELNTQPVLPLGVYNGGATTALDVVVGTHSTVNTRVNAVPWRFDLGRGYRSFAAGNHLRLGGNATIGANGTLRCTGLVWGVQE